MKKKIIKNYKWLCFLRQLFLILPPLDKALTTHDIAQLFVDWYGGKFEAKMVLESYRHRFIMLNAKGEPIREELHNINELLKEINNSGNSSIEFLVFLKYAINEYVDVTIKKLFRFPSLNDAEQFTKTWKPLVMLCKFGLVLYCEGKSPEILCRDQYEFWILKQEKFDSTEKAIPLKQLELLIQQVSFESLVTDSSYTIEPDDYAPIDGLDATELYTLLVSSKSKQYILPDGSPCFRCESLSYGVEYA